ncbi:MAG: large-conductance mechanosensitive channel protein MscL [Lawsonibacter sp.]|nr:large-conductance mechanosensitive channel protein MscL [Lawsonibacter sp.]
MKKFLDEFKAFAMRGNVIDLAVGMIIGSAFSKITNSLVNDVIMPAVSILLGGIDFTDWKLILKQAVVENGQEVSAAISINYGAFLSTVLDFIILAFAIFCMVKAINRLHRKEEAPAPAPAPAEPSVQEELLTEIRDLLKNRSV